MKPANEEVTLYDENPSMFRNRPVEFIVTLVLCLVVVGLIIFLVWWMRCKGTQLTITTDRTSLRKGILSKSITEVWHQDVRNVQLNQTFFQRQTPSSFSRLLGIFLPPIANEVAFRLIVKLASLQRLEKQKTLSSEEPKKSQPQFGSSKQWLAVNRCRFFSDTSE